MRDARQTGGMLSGYRSMCSVCVPAVILNIKGLLNQFGCGIKKLVFDCKVARKLSPFFLSTQPSSCKINRSTAPFE